MSMLGGDVAALFSFGAQLLERRRNIEDAAKKLGCLVEQANWVGPDREKFVSEWQSQHAPALMGVCDDLSEANQRVTVAAQKQQDASANG